MNVDTGEFRALTEQSARADDIVLRLSDALIEQHRVIKELRALLGIPARAVRERHLHLVK